MPGLPRPNGARLGELGAEVERQVAAVDERVDLRGRAQVVLAEREVADRREGLGEGLDVLRLDRETRRRRVAAPALEVARALPQPVVEIEARDRAPRALPVAVGAGDQHDRPVVALDEPRGDDADHALVPAGAGDHVARGGAGVPRATPRSPRRPRAGSAARRPAGRDSGPPAGRRAASRPRAPPSAGARARPRAGRAVRRRSGAARAGSRSHRSRPWPDPRSPSASAPAGRASACAPAAAARRRPGRGSRPGAARRRRRWRPRRGRGAAGAPPSPRRAAPARASRRPRCRRAR